ncbi:hypothetical protein P8452_00905 [Trifolium repens]|nr:hypothetical protein P8452_00905 [Trifolium repens]
MPHNLIPSVVGARRKWKCQSDSECYEHYPNAAPGSYTCFEEFHTSCKQNFSFPCLMYISSETVFLKFDGQNCRCKMLKMSWFTICRLPFIIAFKEELLPYCSLM